MKEKFPDNINEDEVEKELARLAKKIEKDLNGDEDFLEKERKLQEKKILDEFEIYGEAPEEEIDIDEDLKRAA